jgi:hypothetical protein
MRNVLAAKVQVQFKNRALNGRPIEDVDLAKDDDNWRPLGRLHAVGQEAHQDRRLMRQVLQAVFATERVPRRPTLSDEAFAYWAIERLLADKRAAKEETAESQAGTFLDKVERLRTADVDNTTSDSEEEEAPAGSTTRNISALSRDQALDALRARNAARRPRDDSDDDNDAPPAARRARAARAGVGQAGAASAAP